MAFDSWWHVLKWLYARNEADPYRWYLEALILGAILVGSTQRRMVVLALWGVLASTLYGLYAGFMLYGYGVEPLVIRDAPLAWTGLSMVGRPIHLSVAGLALCFGLGTAVSWVYPRIVNWLLVPTRRNAEPSHPWIAWISWTLLSLILMAASYRPTQLRQSAGAIRSLLVSGGHNLWQSGLAYRFDQSLAVRDAPIWPTVPIEVDIYVIMLESYGALLEDDPDIRPMFERARHDGLGEYPYPLYTFRSRAPVRGGGSWMAYASVQTGINLPTPGALAALERRLRAGSWPTLARWLDASHHHVRFAALPVARGQVVPWESMEETYGVDTWVRDAELHYEGPRFSWGPSAPDHVTLGAVMNVVSQSDRPAFVTGITQTGHFPWGAVPGRSDAVDPTSPRHTKHPDASLQRPRKEAYANVMAYQLRSVLEAPQAHDRPYILIALGDHPPPFLDAPEATSGDVLVHVTGRGIDVAPLAHMLDATHGLSHADLPHLLVEFFTLRAAQRSSAPRTTTP